MEVHTMSTLSFVVVRLGVRRALAERGERLRAGCAHKLLLNLRILVYCLVVVELLDRRKTSPAIVVLALVAFGDGGDLGGLGGRCG